MFIQTWTGRKFDYNNPVQFNIADIATALSRMPRFVGHTREFYSVAQHSVLVSQLVPENLAKDALLHDASEAYLCDLPTPAKRMLPDYQKLESLIQENLNQHYDISVASPEIKRADGIALATEKRDLMDEFDLWETAEEPDDLIKVVPLPHDQAWNLFMTRWAEVA